MAVEDLEDGVQKTVRHEHTRRHQIHNGDAPLDSNGFENVSAAGRAGGDLIQLWRAVSEAVDAVVDGTTLEDLRRQAAERRASTKPMYHI